jgi:hypothetical protein
MNVGKITQLTSVRVVKRDELPVELTVNARRHILGLLREYARLHPELYLDVAREIGHKMLLTNSET